MVNLHIDRHGVGDAARLDGGGQEFARPSACATGRAPTALAAFVKRPQAARFKSALKIFYICAISAHQLEHNIFVAVLFGNLFRRRGARRVSCWIDDLPCDRLGR
jgi:hypothetical protein